MKQDVLVPGAAIDAEVEAEADHHLDVELVVIAEMTAAAVVEEIEVTREAVHHLRLQMVPLIGRRQTATPDDDAPEATAEKGIETRVAMIAAAIFQIMIDIRIGILEFHQINSQF